MILPPLLNNCFVGEQNNYFIPADKIELEIINTDISTKSIKEFVDITSSSSEIIVSSAEDEITIQDIKDNVETVCGC